MQDLATHDRPRPSTPTPAAPAAPLAPAAALIGAGIALTGWWTAAWFATLRLALGMPVTHDVPAPSAPRPPKLRLYVNTAHLSAQPSATARSGQRT